MVNKTFVVRSSDRDRRKFPNPANFEIDLPHEIRDVHCAGVIDWSIPLTLLTIDSHNNRFRVVVNDTTTYNIELTPADFTVKDTLAANIASALSSAGTGVMCFVGPLGYLRFTHETLPFTITPVDDTYDLVGLEPEKTISSSLVGTQHVIDASSWPNMDGPDILYLDVPQINGDYVGENIFTYLDLRRVPSGADAAIALHKLSTPVARLSRLSIRLMRDRHNIYDLKGRDFVVIFRFGCEMGS